MSQATDLRYPIGEFEHRGPVGAARLAAWIDEIAALPADLRVAVTPLSEEQLDTSYRPGGWTLRQVVHHLGDSHLNSYIRFKWALTEDVPAIKIYDEAAWAELADYRAVPIATGLEFLEILHDKWVTLLRSLTPRQWQRRFVHPEWSEVGLDRTAGLYAWHGRHHLAHITTTIAREGW